MYLLADPRAHRTSSPNSPTRRAYLYLPRVFFDKVHTYASWQGLYLRSTVCLPLAIIHVALIGFPVAGATSANSNIDDDDTIIGVCSPASDRHCLARVFHLERPT